MPDDSSAAHTSLSLAEKIRYSRHLRLPQIGEAGQLRLRQSRVLLLGVGGLGSPAALYLAAAGIGTLGIAEHDTVALHNLQRQILFREENVGQSKISSAAATLHALNSSTQIIPHPEGLTPENALALFANYDLVLDGTDNFPTRYLANDAAFLSRRPLVHGSIFQFTGHVSLFHPAHGGPCYRCLFPQMPNPASVPTCEQAGVFGALCGTIGSLMAMEAIKHLVGAGKTLQGRLLTLDLLAAQTRTLQLSPDPACPLCGKNPSISGIHSANYHYAGCAAPVSSNAPFSMENPPLEISIEQAREWLASDQPPLLLDVREDDELAICKIAQAIHIPMDDVPARLAELPRDRPILVQCHHGRRSMRVTQLLREKGFPLATNLAGGIDRWAEIVDPAMARY